MSCDPGKPLIISAGLDSFSQIGEHSAAYWTNVVMHVNTPEPVYRKL